MSSEEVARTVAKKIKYYLDVGRREDAFDLSGPYHPARDPPTLRPGPSMQYEGIHDRSLKHYYRNNKVKQQIQKMNIPERRPERDNRVRNDLERTMMRQHYKLKPTSNSPYAVPLIRPRSAHITVDEYFRTRRGARRRKNPANMVGRPPRLNRRAPPQSVSPDERERLVNMATKLIVATETVALPLNRRISRENQTEEAFPTVGNSDSCYSRRHSSLSDPGPRASPHPPNGRPRGRKGGRSPTLSRWGISGSVDSCHGGHGGTRSNLDDIQSQMERLNVQKRNGSYVLSPRHNQRPVSAIVTTTTTSGIGTGSQDSRPKSAGHHSVSPQKDEYNYDDDFYERSSTEVSPINSPRDVWESNDHVQTAEISTQTVEHRGTQTTRVSSEDDIFDKFDKIMEPQKSYYDKWNYDKPDKSNSEAMNHISTSTTCETMNNIGTSTTCDIGTDSFIPNPPRSESVIETQTRRRDLEPKVLTYEIYITTGDKLGAGTSSEVKVNLFGEYGNTGERPLLRSKINKSPFQRGQVDIFALDSVFLGNLESVRVGHNGTALGSGWFLDKVIVKEGSEATRAFEFSCNRWLSSRDDDGQVVRDLPVSRIIPASDVPVPEKSNRDSTYFKYRPASAGKADNAGTADNAKNTISNRPSSAPKWSQQKVIHDNNYQKKEIHDNSYQEKEEPISPISPRHSDLEEKDLSKDREYFDPNECDNESSGDQEEVVTRKLQRNYLDKFGKGVNSKSKSKKVQRSKTLDPPKAKSEEKPKSESEDETESKSLSTSKNAKTKKSKTALIGALSKMRKSTSSSSEISSDESEKESLNEKDIKKHSKKDRKEKRKKTKKQVSKPIKGSEDKNNAITNNEKPTDANKYKEVEEKKNVSFETENVSSEKENVSFEKKNSSFEKENSSFEKKKSPPSSPKLSKEKKVKDADISTEAEEKKNISFEKENVSFEKNNVSFEKERPPTSSPTSPPNLNKEKNVKDVSDSSKSDNNGDVSESVSQNEESEDSSSDNEKVDLNQKDTSKQEVPDAERKQSLQEEYMAGFVAGIKALKEDEKETQKPTSKDDERENISNSFTVHQASEDGNLNRVKELVAQLPELKSKPDERGWTPLHIVAAFGHLEILKWLSVNGVNLKEETPTGYTAIHLAAMNGHVKCIMILSAMGCPLNNRTVDEFSPLHLAAMSGHTECVRWLLANRAKHDLADSNGRTPFNLAEEYKHEECAIILGSLEKE